MSRSCQAQTEWLQYQTSAGNVKNTLSTPTTVLTSIPKLQSPHSLTPPTPTPVSSLPSALQPVDGGGVDGHSLLGGDVRAIFEVVMLSLLLRLQIEPSQPAKVLLTDSLVHGCSTSDSLTVIVSCVRPPISFRLDKAKNHIFHRDGQTRNL